MNMLFKIMNFIIIYEYFIHKYMFKVVPAVVAPAVFECFWIFVNFSKKYVFDPPQATQNDVKKVVPPSFRPT